MAALTKVISGVSAIVQDTQLQLGNEFFTRRLSFGGNWTSIRLVVRGSYKRTLGGGSIEVNGGPFTTGLTIGMTSSLKHYNDPNADCVGVQWNMPFTTAAGPHFYYVWGTGGPLNFYKVGNTVTSVVVGNTGQRAWPYWPTVRCFGCDIVRTATSFTITQLTTSGLSAQASTTFAQLLLSVETPAVSTAFSIEGTTATPAATYTGTGPLDSFFLWNQSSCPVMCVSDIVVCRFA
jgi:hypothetical protein